MAPAGNINNLEISRDKVILHFCIDTIMLLNGGEETEDYIIKILEQNYIPDPHVLLFDNDVGRN